MDYDDNDNKCNNLQLAGEGRSKSISLLRPYAFPKFDLDDSLQGHLRFDSLVETEVFLGIQGQEDNQWIEDFSRGSSRIGFSSVATDSCSIHRHNNVWSEATSSESVEMLLKSVGHEQTIPGKTIIEESNICGRPGSLVSQMETNCSQDIRNDEYVTSLDVAIRQDDLQKDIPELKSYIEEKPLKTEKTSVSQENIASTPDKLGHLGPDGSTDEDDPSVMPEGNHHVAGQFEDKSGGGAEIPGNESSDHNDAKDSSAGHLEGKGGGGAGNPVNESLDDNTAKDLSAVSVANMNSVQILGSSDTSKLANDLIPGVTDCVPTEITDCGINQHESSSTVQTGIEIFDCSTGNGSSQTLESLVCFTSKAGFINVRKNIEASAEPVKGLLPRPGLEESDKDGCTSPTQTSKDVAMVLPADKDSYPRSKDNYENSHVNTDVQQTPDVAECATMETKDSSTQPVSSQGSNRRDDMPEGSPRGVCLASDTVSEPSSHVGNDHEHSIDKGESLHNVHSVISPDTVAALSTSVDMFREKVETETRSCGLDASEVVIGKSSDNYMLLNSVLGPSGEVLREKKAFGQDDTSESILDISTVKDDKEASEKLSVNVKDVGSKEIGTPSKDQNSELPALSEGNTDNEVTFHGLQPELSTPEESANAVLPSAKSSAPATVDSHAEGGERTPSWTGLVLPDKNETAVNISTDNGLADMVGSNKVANDVSSGFGDKVHCSHDSLPSSSDITGKTSAILVSCNVTSEVGSPAIVAVSSGAHRPKESEVHLSCSESVSKVGDAAEAVLPGNDDRSAVKIGCDTMSLHGAGAGADSNMSGSGSPTIISSSELCQDHSANQETGKYEGSETLGRKTQLSKRNLKVKDGSGDDSSFSFKVNSLPDTSERENGNNWSPFTSIVTSTSSAVVEVSTPSRLEKMDSELLHTNFFPSPKVGEVELAYGTPKSNPERRGRRSSIKGSGKEKTRKATRAKETTPHKPPAHVEKVSNDISSPIFTTPHAFQQPFTDMQQVQLRAQIFVYGSIIQGAVPEEACMVSAFGPSDGGRSLWEPLWCAAAERIRNQKFSSSAETPLQGQSQSGANAPDLASKSGSQNILLPSPVSRASSKAAPATVMSPIIPMSSPLWSMTTPSRDGLQSALLQRVPLVDYQHALSPVHPYQTPSVRNVVSPASWPSQGPSPVSWTSHTSSFLTSPHFSARPMMETVKLTPVRDSVVSATPVSKHLTCSPLAHTVGPANLVSGTSDQFDPKKRISSLKKSADLKPRKRKKVPASDDPGQASVLASTQTELVFASLTNSSMVATSTPYLSKINVSKSVNDASPVDSIVHVKKGDTEVVKAITCSDEALTTIAETRNVVAHTVAPTTLVSGTTEEFDPNKRISSPKQQSADPKTRKRKKVPASDDPGQVSVPASAQTEPVFASLTSSSLVATSVPCFSKTDASKSPNDASPVDHIVHIKKGVTEAGKTVTCSDEALTKVAESKSLAEDAAVLAAAATNQCQEVWNKLANQLEAGLTSETEAQLASTAVAIAAAASVAKAAAAAADVASNAALQAKLMADEALLSGRQGSSSQSDLHTIGMATPATILKGDSGSNQSHSILVVAREAAKRRLEAASAASKQAENLDAIVRAAELAIDAVSQAGKIVAMGNPMTLKELIKAGPEGYWKLSQPSNELAAQPCDVGDVKESVDKSPKVSGGSLSLARGLQMNHDKTSPLMEVSSESLDKCTRAADKNPGTAGAGENEMRDLNSCKTSVIDTPDEVAPPEAELEMAMVQEEHGGRTVGFEESCIKEGFRAEVFKDGNGFKAAWFSADVLTIKDGKAYVCFVDVLSGEGSGNLKEWVALEGEGGNGPRIRNVFPHSEGTKKRRRSAMGDYAWAVGDRVDAWIQDSWWEGVVKEKQEKDDTALIVEFPAQGEMSTLKPWQLRPSRIWSDGKWVVWSRLRECSSSYKGDTPREKRQRVGSPPAASEVDKMSGDDHPVTAKTGIPRLLPLSASDKVFNIGKSAREMNKPGPRRPLQTGSQKEGSRVVFGVPKPGKKQKFMEVSKQYSDRGRKKSEANDTAKSATYLVPQAASRGWKNSSNTISKERQAADKPIAASSRRSQNIGRSTSRRAHNPTVASCSVSEPDHIVDAEDSVSHNDSASEKAGRPDHTSSSGAEEADGPLSSMFAHRSEGTAPEEADGPLSSMFAHQSEGTSKKASTSNPQAQRLNKGKVGRSGKLTKIEENKAYNENSGKSMFEAVEPRRSNRRFQPTHRLLEGLQSSMLIPKMPSASHDKGHKSQSNSSRGGK